MIDAINLMVNNLGIELETLVYLFFLLFGFIVYAKDLQLGLLSHTLLFAGGFIMFYAAEMNYTPFIVSMFVGIALLALSLFISKNQAGRGAIV